jgi:hypothetical protein
VLQRLPEKAIKLLRRVSTTRRLDQRMTPFVRHLRKDLTQKHCHLHQTRNVLAAKSYPQFAEDAS